MSVTNQNEAGSSAAPDELGPIDVVVIVYENRWAAPFAAAVRRNGGMLLDFQRISPFELIEVLDAAEAAS